MKKLIQGIIDFRKHSLGAYRDKFAKLALRQTPDALFVACCDSRVVPNIFASSDPGDLFVLRNIGNLIPPYQANSASVAATIEYSLLNLKVRDIIICGHSECGAMEALMAQKTDAWLQHGLSSYERFLRNTEASTLSPCNLLSRINVLQQLENLKTYPVVLEHKPLRIHGWWFDLVTADVYYYDELAKHFRLLDEPAAAKLLTSL